MADLLEEDFNIQQINKAFAFRKKELTQNDLNIISEFHRIVKNYAKITRLEKELN